MPKPTTYDLASNIFSDSKQLKLFTDFIKDTYDIPERFFRNWNKNKTVKDRILLLNEYISEDKPVKVIKLFIEKYHIKSGTSDVDSQEIILSSSDVITLLKQGIPDITLEFKHYISNSTDLDPDIYKRVKGANTYEALKSILERYGVDRHTFMSLCESFSKTPKFVHLSQEYLDLKKQVYDDLDGTTEIDKDSYYKLLNSLALNTKLKHDLLRYLDNTISFPKDKLLDKMKLFKQFANNSNIKQLHATLQKTKDIAVSAAKPEYVSKKFDTEIATFISTQKDNIMSEQIANFRPNVNRDDFKPNTRVLYNTGTVRNPKIYLGTIKLRDLTQCDVILDTGVMVSELWSDFGTKILACSHAFSPYTSPIPLSEIMSWVDVTKWQSKTLRNMLQAEQLLKEVDEPVKITPETTHELLNFGDMDLIDDDLSDSACDTWDYLTDDDIYYNTLAKTNKVELSSLWEEVLIQHGDKVIINNGTIKSPYFLQGEVYDIDNIHNKVDVYLPELDEVVTESLTNGATGIIGFCRKVTNETTKQVTLDNLRSVLNMDDWVAKRALTEYNLSNAETVLETRIVKMSVEKIEEFETDINDLLSDYIDTDTFKINLSPRYAYSLVDYKDAKAALTIGLEDFKQLDFYYNPNTAIEVELDSIYGIDEELTEKTKVLLRVDVKELDPSFIEFDIEEEYIIYNGVIDESYLDIVQIKF